MVFFSSFLPNIYLVFSIKSTVIVKKIKLNKKQIEITLKFVYIKYKAQKAMFQSVVLDLQCKINNKSIKYHKQFCSTYV